MRNWVLLILLGLFAYVALSRGVARLTRIPWWVLWTVVMFPPVVLVILDDVFQQEPDLGLMLLLFATSYIATAVLLRRGRLTPPSASRSPASKPSNTDSQTNPELNSPSSLESSLVDHQPISDIPREKLRGCFPWTIFYLQNMEYRPQAIICRGNLRVQADEAYERVRTNVENLFGQRFLVVLQEGFAGKPFFALVPNPAARRSEADKTARREQPALASILLVATGLAMLLAGAMVRGVAPEDLPNAPWQVLVGWPYALALGAILTAQEGGRHWAARRHHIPISLPYFIPVPFAFGTFGALVRLRAPVPHRKALFDMAIAGPLASLLVALPLLIWGLTQSQVVPFPTGEEAGRLLLLQQFDPTMSILLAIASKIALGSALEPSTVIQFHPAAAAGWLGLLVLALNLMPIGQLDGGHIAHAVYGQQMGANIGRVARLLVLILAFTVQPWLMVWALLLCLLSSGDEPALNDVSDLSEGRDLLGLFMLTLVAIVVLPAPPFLRALLGLM
ncbi:MAG: site-2 protease family protein [Cyanobacteria bacterium P01_F01_bin.33]